jgi:hypothetical protein
MSSDDRPSPPAPRVHRFLSNPLGWLAFLFLEGGAVLGLIAVLPLERFSSNTQVAASLALVVAAVIVNYRIRRIYLADWWESP